MLKVGLLGAGRIAGVHAKAISSNPRSVLVAVSDYYPEAAQKLANRYGADARDTDSIISDSSIDAVLIATPTDTHSELIERSVAEGKAVLCEKPVDLSLKRARACLQRVSRSNQKVMIGFNRRFDPSFAALKEALLGGEIGKPELLSITSFDPAPPTVSYVKTSGGLFRDMMIHDFDMVRFIMGNNPITINATGTSIVDPKIGEVGDVDTAVVTLTFEDGRLAVIKNSRRAVYGYDQRIEVLGSKGLLQAQNMSENLVVKSTVEGVISSKPTHFFLERYMPAFEAEWSVFVAAVLDGKTLPLSIEDGIDALAIAEAATLSNLTGEPVRLADV